MWLGWGSLDPVARKTWGERSENPMTGLRGVESMGIKKSQNGGSAPKNIARGTVQGKQKRKPRMDDNTSAGGGRKVGREAHMGLFFQADEKKRSTKTNSVKKIHKSRRGIPVR